MDSRSSTVLAGGAGGGRDKLSSLGDAALGHILSFLPATEAARTATLSRRWRHVFAAVHTLSFGEAEAPFEMGYKYWRQCSSCGFNDESRALRFVPGVTTGINARHRGARAATAPLRALRVAFDEFGFRGGDETTKAIDGWISYAVHGAGEALEIDLRLGTEPICRFDYALAVSGGGGRGDGGVPVVGSRHDATNMNMDMDMDMHSDHAADYYDDNDAADYYEDNDAAADDDGADDHNSVEDDDGAAAEDGGYAATNDSSFAAAADCSAAVAAAADNDDNFDEEDDEAAADDGGSAATNDSFAAAYYSAAAVAAAPAVAAAASDDDGVEPHPDPMVYVVPRSLFSSCAALRALRLGRCCIDLPSAILLPSLDTLHLTRVTGRRRGAIQRLVSACPSLADLTLEACENLTALALQGSRLRRLALRCCHQLTTVTVGAPELRTFEYRGEIPPAELLTMHARAAPRFCAFDFCGVEHGPALFSLTELLAGVERLHLKSARLGTCFVSSQGGRASDSPWLPMLRDLEITGMLPDDDDESAVATVAGILERTPRLERLSLLFLPEPHPAKNGNPWSPVSKEELNASHELRYDPHARLAAPPQDIEVPSCLRETTMEINFVHYQGSAAQRALAKFLLCNAPVVEEVFWKVARGPLSIQKKLMEEVRRWVMNKSANMVFF